MGQAIHPDRSASWIYSRHDLCDASTQDFSEMIVPAAHIPNQDGADNVIPTTVYAASQNGSIETQLAPVPVAEFCSTSASTTVFALSRSKDLKRELRDFGVNPVALAISNDRVNDQTLIDMTVANQN